MFFLSTTLYKFSLTPILKKLDAFIPALSLLGKNVYYLYVFAYYHMQVQIVNVL